MKNAQKSPPTDLASGQTFVRGLFSQTVRFVALSYSCVNLFCLSALNIVSDSYSYICYSLTFWITYLFFHSCLSETRHYESRTWSTLRYILPLIVTLLIYACFYIDYYSCTYIKIHNITLEFPNGVGRAHKTLHISIVLFVVYNIEPLVDTSQFYENYFLFIYIFTWTWTRIDWPPPQSTAMG